MRAIEADEVVVGMALPWSVFDRNGKLLFGQGLIVTCQAQLEMLLSRGLIVPESATSGGAMAPPADQPPLSRAKTAAHARSRMPPVFSSVLGLRQELLQLHDALLVGQGGDHGEQVRDLATRLKALVMRDADAALAAVQLQVGDEVHIARLLHAAALCQLLTQALSLPMEERLSLMAAALTFDLALTPIAPILNRQRGGLTPEQRALVDAHPERSVELLRAAGVEDELWLDAILHHHERLDGTGYPHKLQGEAVQRGARMLAVVDIYSAMVRQRGYRGAVHAQEALRNLFLERGKAVDEALASLLIREIGVYPPGSLVQLVNGEIGMVVRRGSNAARPIVARLINANGTLAAHAARRDTADAEFAIRGSAAHEKYAALTANVAELWAEEARTGEAA